jgi:26S proteasome regulatory subunit N6
MVLAKIIGNRGDEAISLANEKLDEAFIPELLAVAKAQRNRSLEEFEKVVVSRAKELEQDAVLVHHLKELNERLLEDNLMKLVQPYSRVEIDHIAKLIKLPTSRVLTKLSEMILDGKLLGTLDQGVGVLVVFEKDANDASQGLYSDVLKVIQNTSQILDTLGTKANLLVV